LIPRLVIKTHRDVGKPGILSLLLRYCTSPVEASNISQISTRLSEVTSELSIVPKLNKSAARYAVILAEKLGLLSSNLSWDWRGQAIIRNPCVPERTIYSEYLELSSAETLLYLKYFIEADGSAIVGLCKAISSVHKLNKHEAVKHRLIDDIFADVYEAYMSLTSDWNQLAFLQRRIAELREKDYDEDTRKHKIWPRLDVLRDMGLIERDGDDYVPTVRDGRNLITILMNEIQDVPNLEKRLEHREHFEILAKVLDLRPSRTGIENLGDSLQTLLVDAYKLLREPLTGLASIKALADMVLSNCLVSYSCLVGLQEFDDYLEKLRITRPKSLRFHVDQLGFPAYVILAEELLYSQDSS
jgi:hypothetical protein